MITMMRNFDLVKLTVLTAGLLTASACALAQSDYVDPGKYTEWHHKGVEVQDPEAEKNVRQLGDLTRPMHGPWIMNPTCNSMTVCWISRTKCAAGIQYREKGTEEFKTQWQTTYGQLHFFKENHAFHLKNLKPGTEYEYRFLTAWNYYQGKGHRMFTGREIYTFKTPDPKRDTYKAAFFADVHGGERLNLDPRMERSDALKSDMFFYLGDTVEDSFYEPARYYTTFGYLDDITRLWGKSKPTIFVRGNHDAWGVESHEYGEYMPSPDGKTYQAFSQGPVLYVIFDYFNGHYGNSPVAMQIRAYMEEQLEWLRALKKTDQWKKAKFRVVMAHVSPHDIDYNKNKDFAAGVAWRKELNGNTKEDRIHIFLAGHEHRYRRLDPRLQKVKVGKMRGFVNDFNYTNVVLDQTECMTLDVFPEKLVFKSYDWTRGKDVLRDSFEIYPDGSVKDLMKVKVNPLLTPEEWNELQKKLRQEKKKKKK